MSERTFLVTRKGWGSVSGGTLDEMDDSLAWGSIDGLTMYELGERAGFGLCWENDDHTLRIPERLVKFGETA